MDTPNDTLDLPTRQDLDAWLHRLAADGLVDLTHRERAIADWLDTEAPHRTPAWETGFWDALHGLRPRWHHGDYYDGWSIGWQFVALNEWDTADPDTRANFYQDFPHALVEQPNTRNLIAYLAARGLA